MKRHTLLVATLTALTFTFAADDARAETYVGADFSAAVPIPDTFSVEPTTGPSVSLRFGYKLPIPVLYVAAEALGSWQNFAHEESPQQVLSGRGGLRVGVDAGIALKLYSHLGYSSLSGKGTDYTINVDGLSWDAGLALDVTILPVVDFGIHGGYVTLVDDESNLNWVEAGVHVELSF